ncbi:tRNA (adenosine(37)-N6)-threonylcarbamoyltransferase complex ATPase subunit type 1 TsaE [Patescibacteria group bacterium]|nr:tRNA (adenosine(37)-N6)-threonylcarbamoyltransferase complex ATPase subunit type 1 TsaE [Patescibacteria group bacterium]MBU1500609.1 tRNA (adenosine(37)-N6)-threonylcarbamoyltransferase complex ATPase subunit type 1 TsaE [Patescibacteria group bacterium]MBU2080350.1 tRNA (adenosine(37)-N6)-threonylcarbamoyltransferase complex ATPase subunit type 1 TsaE [Patescibacteria group bacterium]MBU2124238.1 tRNA (adenosine(37)-N6)-threonylcarbamoyltransferase complex ATPase subunit type 1 TsaE [Patesc
MTRTLASLEELVEEARLLAKRLSPKEGRATLVTLSGELGAGKTTFVQALASALGVTEHVTSPTFVLAKTYSLSGQSFSKVVHIDAYRLNKGADLKSIGFDEAYTEPGTLIVFEWPERVEEGLPAADIEIALTVTPEEHRIISYA